MEGNDFWIINQCPVCGEFYSGEEGNSESAVVNGHITEVCMPCIRRLVGTERGGFSPNRKMPLIEESFPSENEECVTS